MSFSLTAKFFANARGLTFSDGSGVVWSFNKNTNAITAAGSAGGVLSSVGLADTSTTPIYAVTNSPLTANGTLDITLKTQAANLVLTGPTTGVATQPTFRALVVADLPTGIPNANLQNSSLTVTAGTGLSGGGSVSLGSSVTLSLTTPVVATNGGTGQSGYAVGDILYASTATALSRLADVAAGSYLLSGGVATAPLWSTLTLPNAATQGDIFFATAANVMGRLADVAAGSYLRSGGAGANPVWSTITIPNAATLGDTWYSDVANDIAALAGNTTATKKFLTQTGTGSVSAAPAWGTIAAGDLPANGANPTAKVALAAVNGSATTWMRSDAAPALDVTISPTWTGNHTFTPSAGVAITVNGQSNFVTTNAAGFATNSAWSAKYTVFGPNAGSTTGAAVAIGYDTTADAGGIICLAPNVGWKNLGLWCNALTVLLAGTATFGVTSNGAGYVTGVGGAVTQLTSRVTGVTLNKMCGAITLFAAAGTAAFTTFTVTNSTVAATDTVVLSVKSGTNVYLALVTAVGTGSFNITFWTTGGTSSDSPVINFAIIKAVIS